MAKKNLLDGLDITPLAPPIPPNKCADVVVIPTPGFSAETTRPTYNGRVIAHAKDGNGVVRFVKVEYSWTDDSFFSKEVKTGSHWESVHDVFEVE
jgi:hypothetical protein